LKRKPDLIVPTLRRGNASLTESKISGFFGPSPEISASVSSPEGLSFLCLTKKKKQKKV